MSRIVQQWVHIKETIGKIKIQLRKVTENAKWRSPAPGVTSQLCAPHLADGPRKLHTLGLRGAKISPYAAV